MWSWHLAHLALALAMALSTIMASASRFAVHQHRFTAHHVDLTSSAMGDVEDYSSSSMGTSSAIGDTTNATSASPVTSLPLRTHSRWIVDADGRRVKLACVNWAAHMENMVPEGLAERSVAAAAHLIRALGFNCVRMPFASAMFAAPDTLLGTHLPRWMSTATLAAFWQHNPQFRANTTVMEVFEQTMIALHSQRIVVIIDNHMTVATWCCSLNDGNRWWNQRSFDVSDWLLTLERAAKFARDHPNVVGLGLRNEVLALVPLVHRGEWLYYMRMGASVVHAVNPELLVVVGGEDSASKLTAVKLQGFVSGAMAQTMREKLVFEVHIYNLLYIRPLWNRVPDAVACGWLRTLLDARNAFVLTPDRPYTAPLWMGEFGLDVSHFNSDKSTLADVKWLTCLSGWLRDTDIGWAYWQLHGGYYYRQGVADFREEWGLTRSGRSGDLLGQDDQDKVVRSQQLMAILRELMPARRGPGIGGEPLAMVR